MKQQSQWKESWYFWSEKKNNEKNGQCYSKIVACFLTKETVLAV